MIIFKKCINIIFYEPCRANSIQMRSYARQSRRAVCSLLPSGGEFCRTASRMVVFSVREIEICMPRASFLHPPRRLPAFASKQQRCRLQHLEECGDVTNTVHSCQHTLDTNPVC